jgi:pimeloyl-ACP methyl ester carboxylesterase
MPVLTIAHSQFHYDSEGEGFPLLLMPEPQGNTAFWLPCMPLLGELCRTIAYDVHRPASHLSSTVLLPGRQAAADLAALCQALTLPSIYLASPLASWPAALYFAQQAPGCVHGLLLCDMPSAMPSPSETATTAAGAVDNTAILEADLAMPTLFLLANASSPGRLMAAQLAAHCAPCTTVSLDPPHTTQQLGHSMMRFLIQQERRRNLVRGASFLL